MTEYPSWDQKDTYLADAEQHMRQVRADVAADTTNVWQSIDKVIAALHKLRNAAGAEQMRRHDAMVARMEAEEADRAARPALPPADVVLEARRLVGLGYPVSARLMVRDHSSMSISAAAEFVANLSSEVSV